MTNTRHSDEHMRQMQQIEDEMRARLARQEKRANRSPEDKEKAAERYNRRISNQYMGRYVPYVRRRKRVRTGGI